MRALLTKPDAEPSSATILVLPQLGGSPPFETLAGERMEVGFLADVSDDHLTKAVYAAANEREDGVTAKGLGHDVRWLHKALADYESGSKMGLKVERASYLLDDSEATRIDRAKGLKEGDKVAVGPRIKPKTFINAHGRVTTIHREQVKVTLDPCDRDRNERATGKAVPEPAFPHRLPREARLSRAEPSGLTQLTRSPTPLCGIRLARFLRLRARRLPQRAMSHTRRSTINAPSACIECLRRSRLLAALGPYIERSPSSAATSSLRDLLARSNEDLVQLVAPKVARQLLARAAAFSEQRLKEGIALSQCWSTCRHGDHCPDSLRLLNDAPWALFGRGDQRLLASHAAPRTVAIVGARRATSYGREVARELGRDLANAERVVVSGMSFGIDGCAHRGALDGGRTIAVLGCGPDIAYPASHRSLWRRITETGLLLSELPPGAIPWGWTSCARSRIIAGLAGMSVVVEAAERSRSLVTIEHAAHLGRIVGAVPGPVTSASSVGPNALLAKDAFVVRGAKDVIDGLDGIDNHNGTEDSDGRRD